MNVLDLKRDIYNSPQYTATPLKRAMPPVVYP